MVWRLVLGAGVLWLQELRWLCCHLAPWLSVAGLFQDLSAPDLAPGGGGGGWTGAVLPGNEPLSIPPHGLSSWIMSLCGTSQCACQQIMPVSALSLLCEHRQWTQRPATPPLHICLRSAMARPTSLCEYWKWALRFDLDYSPNPLGCLRTAKLKPLPGSMHLRLSTWSVHVLVAWPAMCLGLGSVSRWPSSTLTASRPACVSPLKQNPAFSSPSVCPSGSLSRQRASLGWGPDLVDLPSSTAHSWGCQVQPKAVLLIPPSYMEIFFFFLQFCLYKKSASFQLVFCENFFYM